MQALYNFFEKNTKQGVDVFVLTVEKDPNGYFEFTISPGNGDSIKFVLTKSGLTPKDNRGLLG